MKYNLPDDFEKESIDFDYFKRVATGSLNIYLREKDGKYYPSNEKDFTHISGGGWQFVPESGTSKTISKNLDYYTNLMYQYGNRLTSMTIQEFANYIIDFCVLNSYKYSNMLLTEMQEYGMIDNYDKNSTITTDFEGTEKDKVDYNGNEYLNKEGTETHTNTKSGSESLSHGLTNALYKNATNNSDTLTLANKNQNSGSDNTTYNNVKDELKIEYDDRSDVKGFSNRHDDHTKTFEDRKNIVTEYTHGNIGVTTSAQMLEAERELADFSTFKTMFIDLVKEVSIML